ncbi:glycosyltransferase family 4 protein [Candidatus Woesearchaeota archaeon]|nr:glycosyltransferase family 4 protein [Candidatus Woesearchaeota archaeon]
MRVILNANAQLARVGIGSRVYQVLLEGERRKTKTQVYCRWHPRLQMKYTQIYTPVPCAKWVYYGIAGMRYYVSMNLPAVRWFHRKFEEFYDRRVASKLNGRGIFHSWDTSLASFRRAKELGMTTIKDCVIQNDEGIAKLYPDDPYYKDAKMLPELSESLQYIDYYLVPCEFVGRSYAALGIPQERIRQVEFGADTEKFRPGKKKDDVFRICFAGLVTKRKGIETILKAVYELQEEMDQYELVFAGRVVVDARSIVHEYAKKLKHFRLAGHISQEELSSLFQQCSVFTFPSYAESSAKVNYEALAAGLPLITTYNTGTVVRDGKEGFIIDTDDVPAMKRRLLELYTERKKLQKMSEAARKRALEFTWARYAQRVHDLYAEVLS